ncbi:hypothetical protein V8F33_007135 [Rhypophila sp. PSN 637]
MRDSYLLTMSSAAFLPSLAILPVFFFKKNIPRIDFRHRGASQPLPSTVSRGLGHLRSLATHHVVVDPCTIVSACMHIKYQNPTIPHSPYPDPAISTATFW